MIPLRDDNPTSRPAILTLVLILLNVLVHVRQVGLSLAQGPEAVHGMMLRMGLVPARMFGLVESHAGLPVPLTLMTSMFLHGGFFHLGGNMLYLWIFGNNVEDRLGRLRYLLFYLGGGVLAALCQAAVTPTSRVPMIGASGAVAAVLGAYLVLYPRARVHTLVIFLFFLRVIPIPAVVVLGLWFVLQLLNGLPSLAQPGLGGVAWFAHIGGFLFGMVVIRWLLPRRGRRRLKPRRVRDARGFEPWD